MNIKTATAPYRNNWTFNRNMKALNLKQPYNLQVYNILVNYMATLNLKQPYNLQVYNIYL